MYTFCPTCLTVFRIQAAHLNAAAGKVRCHHCSAVFVTHGHLYDHVMDAQAARICPSPQEPEGLPVAAEEEAAPVGDMAEARPVVNELPSVAQAQAVTHTEVSVEPEKSVAAVSHAMVLSCDDWDSFGQPADASGPPSDREATLELARLGIEAELQRELAAGSGRGIAAKTWFQALAVLLLCVGLAGQFVYLQRNHWSQDSQMRPWILRFCAVLGCQVPLRRELALLDLLEREVRDDPQREEVVLVRATFINRADFPQPYPVFEVRFSDLSGTPVAQRQFQPEEYLHANPVPESMAPQERVRLQLEVLDPGRRAVSFTMDFR